MMRLSPERVNGFRLAEQALAPLRTDARHAAAAAGWLPVRESAYLAMAVRVAPFTRAALDDLVFREKSLVEVQTVRGESYLVPREMVPAALRSPAPALVEGAERALERGGLPAAGRGPVFDAVRRTLAEGPRPLPDLMEKLLAAGGAPARFLGLTGVLPAVLLLLRLAGEVVRTRLTPPLDAGPPVFALAAQAFPDLDVPGLDPREALKILCAWYFRVHGPATEADFGWFSGAGRAEIAGALEAHRKNLVEVELGDLPFTFRMTASRLDELVATERPGVEPVNLVPFLDPWLASHEGRAGRFVRPEDLPRIAPGPALPAILVGGVAAGRWEVERRSGEIRLAWFTRQPAGTVERATRKAAELSAFVRDEMKALPALTVPTPDGPAPIYT